ncbi:glutathione S-transferase family protein [Pseudomonas sp. UBA2684]|uniref:glutathione S-transferase family protein n=1 Tax=Pseudomonas sp. UBA2684 TaxID=1947311 RepID=UPI000E90AE4B|nr:glutathione S-transferase [Pseudomonas sp. UBA2684]HBX55401.1 glutathione S-transferase [Pseudomonas sp.]|tara:strand:+ start:823 stop:1488 length:666 start_codon:yes stop_codon:yes gene_type:complete
MFKLYGFAVSNYFNMVKLALLEKGLAFEVITLHGNQSDEFLSISPRGKVPVLGVEQGFINETSAILDYLEECAGGTPLLPAEPFARAQVRALMKEIELYIELPARLGYPQAFFGMEIPDALKTRCKAELLAGIATLKRHGRFTPYVAGDSFSLADIYFLYSVDLACVVAKKLFNLDLLGDFSVARDLLVLLNKNPHVQQIAADKEADMPGFLALVQAQAKG